MSLQPFVAKLSASVDLSQSEVSALSALPFIAKTTAQDRNAISKGERPTFLYVVLEGWAGRYDVRPDGSRRITGFLLPGDFCGIHATCYAALDHGITALSTCTVARIDLADFQAVVSTSRSIERAIWQAKLTEEAILRMWLLNSVDAARTVAHLFCEIDARLHAGDSTNKRNFHFPLKQEQIGDAVGITPVHVNRMLATLRRKGLATLVKRTLTIPDVQALRKEASFDPAYLHTRS